MRGTKRAEQHISGGLNSGGLKWPVLILVPLLAVYIGVSVISTYSFRKQVVTYAQTFVDFYMDQIETTVSNINYRMSMFVLGENEAGETLYPYIQEIKSTKNMAFRDYFSNKLRDIFLMYSMEYGNEYQFFSYFPELNLFIGANTNEQMSQLCWEDYTEDIRKRLKSGSLTPNSGTSYWQLVGSGTKNAYILKLYYIKDIYVGCWIRPQDLLEPLENAIEGGKSTVILYDDKNRPLSGGKEPFPKTVAIERQFQVLPFRIEMFISDYGLFQKTFLMHMTLALVGFAVLFMIVLLIYLLYRKVLRPMIHGLEREIYEGEIKKQMMYMEYLKLQIEPHFYLNCLNFIYNMIDLCQYSQAALMASMTANYMRYLFNNNRDFVFIWEELEHIRHYMEIQKLRFEEAFDYYIEQETEAKDVKIPPLLIQTFVENCVKYAMDLDSKLFVTVTIFSEVINDASYTNICVTDNGPGLPEELLEKLKDSRDYMEHEKGHIGIANALERLYYIYKEQAWIEFYNGPAKGAVIDIHIPSILPEQGGDKDEIAHR